MEDRGGSEADDRASIVKRLGATASELGLCGSGETCPVLYELDTGDVLVAGADVTSDYAAQLLDDDRIADDERIVRIPRLLVDAAARDLLRDGHGAGQVDVDLGGVHPYCQ